MFYVSNSRTCYIPQVLQETVVNPKVTAIIYGCTRFFIGVQELYDANGVPKPLLQITMGVLGN